MSPSGPQLAKVDGKPTDLQNQMSTGKRPKLAFLGVSEWQKAPKTFYRGVHLCWHQGEPVNLGDLQGEVGVLWDEQLAWEGVAFAVKWRRRTVAVGISIDGLDTLL